MNDQQRNVLSGGCTTSHIELEIERELLLQRNNLTSLEIIVNELVNRLSMVLRPSEPVGPVEAATAGSSPVTSLGEAIRTHSDNIDVLTNRLSDALRRLELS